jgi:hypothetical protein
MTTLLFFSSFYVERGSLCRCSGDGSADVRLCGSDASRRESGKAGQAEPSNAVEMDLSGRLDQF